MLRRSIIPFLAACLALLGVAAVFADSGAPGISAVGTSGVSTSTAAVEWTTATSSDSVVRYATSTADLASSTAAVMEESDLATTTSHSIALSGLMPDTEYFFEVESSSDDVTEVDDNGGAYHSFTTDALTAPVVIGISVVASSGVSTTTATVSWMTVASSDSVVRYATSLADLASSTAAVMEESDVATTTSHSIPLSGLMPNIDYFFEVESATDGDSETDDNGGAYYRFTTDVVSVPGVIGISAVGTSGVSTSTAAVEWTTATSSDSVVRYATSTADLASSTAAVMEESDVATTTSHSIPLSGLMPNTEYFFEVESATDGDSETDDKGGAYYSFTTDAVEDGEYEGEVVDDGARRRSFPGTVYYLGDGMVTVAKNGAMANVSLGDVVPKMPGGPNNRGTFDEEANVVVHAEWDGSQWVAIWVIVKPVKPSFIPAVGPVVSVDEGGVITILLPDGKTKRIKGPKGASAPTIGEVVTAFVNEDGSDEDGEPPTATGLVKASKIANRLQSFLEKLAAKDTNLPQAAIDARERLVNNLAAILEGHAGQRLSIIHKLKTHGTSTGAAIRIQKALEDAEASQAKGKSIAEDAKGKSKGPGSGRSGKGIFGPIDFGAEDEDEQSSGSGNSGRGRGNGGSGG